MSGVELRIALERLPLAPGVAEVAAQLGSDPAELAATAGEDYELCVCVEPARRAQAEAAASITWVGEAGEGPPAARFLAGGEERRLAGFEHVA
jgi:thiamine-monophosphate kinase